MDPDPAILSLAFCLLLFEGGAVLLHNFLKIKSQKEVKRSKKTVGIKVFLIIFA
jgi:hypothetical protein